MFGIPVEIDLPANEGGYGGGDPVLLDDIFGVPREDKYNQAASHIDGGLSILTGIAANKSINPGLPVRVDDSIHIP